MTTLGGREGASETYGRSNAMLSMLTMGEEALPSKSSTANSACGVPADAA